MEKHEIIIALSTKPDARGLWQARCSCGDYVSAPGAEFSAQVHGEAHVKAHALLEKWKAEDRG